MGENLDKNPVSDPRRDREKPGFLGSPKSMGENLNKNPVSYPWEDRTQHRVKYYQDRFLVLEVIALTVSLVLLPYLPDFLYFATFAESLQ
jgi:hypothetical protein